MAGSWSDCASNARVSPRTHRVPDEPVEPRRRLKPFVFLDYFDVVAGEADGFGLHLLQVSRQLPSSWSGAEPVVARGTRAATRPCRALGVASAGSRHFLRSSPAKPRAAIPFTGPTCCTSAGAGVAGPSRNGPCFAQGSRVGELSAGPSRRGNGEPTSRSRPTSCGSHRPMARCTSKARGTRTAESVISM